MKSFKILYIILFILITLGCNSDDTFISETESLPLQTFSGTGTFGCLINDKSWVTVNRSDAGALYRNDILQIYGEVNEPGVKQYIRFVFIDLLFIEQKEYSLLSYPNSYCEFISISPNKCSYEYMDVLNGTVEFIKVDIPNRIIAGNFNFVITKNDCDTLSIKKGRFDLNLNL